LRTNAQQKKNLAPALAIIHDFESKKNHGDGLRVLIHIFSNGGSWTACQLADAYLVSTTSSPSPQQRKHLPMTALILDSTPSLPNPQSSHTAICEALPRRPRALRTLGSLSVWGFIAFTNTFETISGRENLTLNIRRRLNDPSGAFMQGDLKRVYIYSQGDALIPANDVETHAKDAVGLMGEAGKARVQIEDFKTSSHVGHVRTDPVRYWGIVERLWRESVQD